MLELAVFGVVSLGLRLTDLQGWAVALVTTDVVVLAALFSVGGQPGQQYEMPDGGG